MPKVKRSRKAPPDGWELIEPTLDELDQKMREGELGSSVSVGCVPGINGKRQAVPPRPPDTDMFCLLFN